MLTSSWPTDAWFFFLILEYKTHLHFIKYIRKNVGVGGKLLHKHIPYLCTMYKKN